MIRYEIEIKHSSPISHAQAVEIAQAVERRDLIWETELGHMTFISVSARDSDAVAHTLATRGAHFRMTRR